MFHRRIIKSIIEFIELRPHFLSIQYVFPLGYDRWIFLDNKPAYITENLRFVYLTLLLHYLNNKDIDKNNKITMNYTLEQKN